MIAPEDGVRYPRVALPNLERLPYMISNAIAFGAHHQIQNRSVVPFQRLKLNFEISPPRRRPQDRFSIEPNVNGRKAGSYRPHRNRSADAYTNLRLRRWLCNKHKHPGTGLTRYPDEYLYKTLGLIRLPLLPQRFPWAKA